MQLSTMDADPAWDADAHAETVDIWAAAADNVTVKVWGGDWCKDCQRQLPEFGAALQAAGIPDERIEHYPVEKADDGSKTGPNVEAYDIEFIPTVVVEREGEELARFVEDADEPIAVWLADRLEAEATA